MNKRLGTFIIVIFGVLTLVMGYFASTLKFDYDFEKFFPTDDPDLIYYNEFREQYENDNDYSLIGIKNNEGIFNKEFLIQVDSLSRDLLTISQVVDVQSPTNVEQVIITPLGPIRDRFIHLDQENLKKDSINIYRQHDLVGNIFSKDSASITVFIKYENRLAKAGADSALTSMNSMKYT